MIVLFGISNCDTIKKTRRWLDSHKLDYEFHDYKKQGCNTKLARTLTEVFELDRLINKRGTTWRKLPEQVKNSLTTAKARELMTANPSVIKRPILKIGDEWALGYAEKLWEALIKKQ
ncbi:MAG: Spx/MgsR family RNA polymerase-binding regulatory protein [Gammaproteobacteria bacterium]